LWRTGGKPRSALCGIAEQKKAQQTTISPYTGIPMLNMDFSRPIVCDTANMDWFPSPKPGVWRKPLAREEKERGHATSIVRYEPGASFHSHNHPQGEEILVLEGTFSDATGDFHAGTYFRNPEGFVHAPFSKDGCVILVKLHQFQAGDKRRLAIETATGNWQELEHGIRVQLLHEYRGEKVVLLKLPASAPMNRQANTGGEEIYVISGSLRDESASYPTGSWMRFPPGDNHLLVADEDALIWMKSGHLG
jgi:anti-sigma factor ChrR (cupin superfamily)